MQRLLLSQVRIPTCTCVVVDVSVFVFFFFSSRRRHTRYWRDWSSDLCSSDLVPRRQVAAEPVDHHDRADRPGRAQCLRSEERRVGKECRSRWWPDHEKKKKEARVAQDECNNIREADSRRDVERTWCSREQTPD